jgi:pimeloyl-ACP methyl ester carboxylesterase
MTAQPGFGVLRRVQAGQLDVAFVESGSADGTPVFLMHGFPYDVHAYAEVAPLLAATKAAGSSCRICEALARRGF